MQCRSMNGSVALGVSALFAMSALFACGGPQVPDHDGYRSKWKKRWEKPKKLELDEDLEAEIDGELSYPKRKRVRWFMVELPEDGELKIDLQSSPLGAAAEEDDEDAEDPFDVGFELYNASYKQLLRADQAEDDAGDRKKTRTAYELLAGEYLIHVYLQRRIDEAEYTLRVKFQRGSVEPQTNFPKEVAFIENLAVVPAIDDAPPPPKPKPKCRGRKCKRKKKRTRKRDKENPEPAAEPATGSMKAKITVVRAQGSGGTEITLNRGSNHGVAKGWKGKLVTKKGKAIPGGSFKIRSVKTNSSKAKVSVSADAVKQAGRARLEAP